MSSSAKKQLTISKFFAPVRKKGGPDFETDEDVEIKNKHSNQATAPLKRTKSIDIANVDLSPKSKKARKNEEEIQKSPGIENNENQTWTSLSPTKRKLEAFSAGSGKGVNMEESDQEEMPVNINNGTSTSSVKNRLEGFRSPKASEGRTITSQPSENSNKVGQMEPLPGMKLTPLEQQVVAIKNKYPDTLLFIECGYKYRFFGNDAETAAKELNIVAHLDHNFMTASIPTHRLHVHVRRLVAKGHKVGVVKQTETAAIKAAGSNKNAPFVRELSALYTRSTLIGEDVSPSGGVNEVTGDDMTENVTNMLLVLKEDKSSVGKESMTSISIVAIQPSTGDIIYDTFEDSSTRSELWCHLDHIQPVEALIAEDTSSLTVQTITGASVRSEDRIRIERLTNEKFDYSDALRRVCEMFEGEEGKVKHITSLPSSVVGCIGATLEYLKEFKLDRIVKMAGTIQPYSMKKHYMRLSGATVRNLEVLSNGADGGVKGSLFWALDKTQTKFGSRLLRRWIVQPLLRIEEIEERQDMIEDIMNSDSPVYTTLKNILYKLPDFERALTTIFHKKCSPHEFWIAVNGLSHVHAKLSRVSGNLTDIVRVPAMRNLIEEVLDGLSDIQEYASNINESSAKEGKKTTLFKSFSRFPKVIQKQGAIKQIEKELDALRSDICKVLRLPGFKYTTVSGLEYLVEVKNAQLKAVPKDWNKINTTKACCRFRPPEVEKLFTELQILREELQAECHSAWLQVLDSFSEHYQQHRQAVRFLATIDVLIALANVAKSHGFCRPKIHASDGENCGFLHISGGKHPVISQLKYGEEQYVSNDTNLKGDGQRVMLVTGPNMGGKSCYMRQVALIALMSQIGSYVPADSVKMSILDAIYTRMGAADEIYSGRSTFMVEVGETADIMREATSHSLVILDELGRGTSTHDGVAIAMASLDYFLNKVKCLTIFVTHYLPLTEFEVLYPECVGNFHMAFLVNEEELDGVEVVTFLYQLTAGSAGQSYGLNVARLAKIPPPVLKRASDKSKELAKICGMKRKGKEIFKKFLSTTESPRSLVQELISAEI
ncbi:DNA mismatch repair protein Msh3-like [Macrobrachium nipponense]|uniref:DNA mismatch repair protein Msh3-like n=1 Tax=Macrobrachium nipponense TaxID=159736 RepID=UPI0030C8C6BF